MTIRDEVLKLLVTTLKRADTTPPSDDQRFLEDLGVSSLQAVELVLAVEQHFGIAIADDEAVNTHTVGEAIALVSSKVARRVPKAVIFDVDGTLIDSVDCHAHAWQDAFREFGHEFPFADIRSQIGKGGDQLMPVFLSKPTIDAVGKELEARRGVILRERYFPQITSFPRVRELLKRLAQDGIQVVLASSAKKDELEFYKRVADIADLVEKETSSDDVEKSKPHPDIFEAALALLDGVDRSDIVVVGDTPYDAEAAGKAGLLTIAVLCGGFAEEDLRRAGAIAIYADPAALLDDLDDPRGESFTYSASRASAGVPPGR